MARILIACEYSGKVRDRFLAVGHDAISCDLLPTESPNKDESLHYRGDVRDILSENWDCIIAFPDCTYLTSSAEWAYKDPEDIKGKRLSPNKLYGAARREARVKAIEFVKEIWNACDTVAIENPVGALSTAWKEPDQYIQPYEFGDDASKKPVYGLRISASSDATQLPTLLALFA